jgi:hypothetical protein
VAAVPPTTGMSSLSPWAEDRDAVASVSVAIAMAIEHRRIAARTVGASDHCIAKFTTTVMMTDTATPFSIEGVYSH